MSDGNFNRSLLPHTPYQSGMKTGKSMARQQALQAFYDFIKETFPALSEEESEAHKTRFRQLLSTHIK